MSEIESRFPAHFKVAGIHEGGNILGMLKKIGIAVLAGALSISLTSCFSSSGTLTFKIKQFNTAAGTTTKVTLTEIKICAENVFLYDESGVQVGADRNTSYYPPVNGDLSTGAEKALGPLDAPTGFRLGKVTIRMSLDGTYCGEEGGHNFKVNGYTQREGDVDFSFKVDPAVELASGQTIVLDLQNMVDAVADRVIAGTLTYENLKATVEAVTGTATVQ